MTRLLLLEDGRRRLSPLRSALEVTGYEVDTATAGGVALLGVVRPALAVLDIAFSAEDEDALPLIRSADPTTPLLVIGADSDADLVRALAWGADDYMAGPA